MLKNKTKNHWEAIGKSYSLYWKSKLRHKLNKKELQFINKYLPKTGYVLDIGIGSGRIIENYLNNSQLKSIDGIDWTQSMVEYCRNKFQNEKRVKNLAVCDISKDSIPFKKDYDFISAIRVLKYNKNWQEVIGKIINILTTDSIFIFTMANKNAFLRITKSETEIYKTTEEEIEEVVSKHAGQILDITAFCKLPDEVYGFSNNRLYVSIILLLESLLKKIFGSLFLGREFFVAVKKI